jgi:hypothetical protein
MPIAIRCVAILPTGVSRFSISHTPDVLDRLSRAPFGDDLGRFPSR